MTTFKHLTKSSVTLRWPLTPLLLRSHVGLYPRIILSKSHENMSKYVDTLTFFFKNLNQRSLTPRWPLTPSLLRSHVWLYPRIHCVQVPWKYIKVCGYSDPFFKNLNQRSLTPGWPLTTCLVKSHVVTFFKLVPPKGWICYILGSWLTFKWLLFCDLSS